MLEPSSGSTKSLLGARGELTLDSLRGLFALQNFCLKAVLYVRVRGESECFSPLEETATLWAGD